MKIEEVQRVMYKVGKQEFLSKEEAEHYMSRLHKLMNTTYYDVVYTEAENYELFGKKPIPRRKLIGAPGSSEENIAWVAAAMSTFIYEDLPYKASYDDTPLKWEIVGKHTFSSFREFSDFIKEWEYKENFRYSEDILINGLEPEVLEFRQIHETADNEE